MLEPRKSSLTDIVESWLGTLTLPGGPLDRWPEKRTKQSGRHPSSISIRGESHWYTFIGSKDPRHPDHDDWILTVRSNFVEVLDAREGRDTTVISWHTIDAADPEFFVKLENDLRAALDHLSQDNPPHWPATKR